MLAPRWIAPAVAGVTLLVAATAAGEHRRLPAAPAALFDNPCIAEATACQRHALDGFAEGLAAARSATQDHVLRVSYVGDSLTADDQITSRLRTRLDALVGDGGPGFVFAVSPHPFCQHRAVGRWVGGAWRVHGISTAVPGDHLLGLGGSAENDGDGVIRLVPTTPEVRSVDVHYLAQPHGGTLTVAADGAVLDEIATGDDHKHGGFAQVAVPAGAHAIELRTHGRVRLFGASLEALRGAVVDNLGVVNATAKAIRHNLEDHFRNQLAHRAADLVVIMLGTNEAEWLHPGRGVEEHEQVLGEVLASIRSARPEASCLVVSPFDQLDWRVEGAPPRTSVPAMVEAQRRAAAAHGCAFWDAYAWMGGKGASREWYKRGLVVKDFQHPTSDGAELIADALFRGLVGPE
jgi:lysophospholipase L1-like esterase